MLQNAVVSEYIADKKEMLLIVICRYGNVPAFLCANANFIVYPVGISVYFCYNE